MTTDYEYWQARCANCSDFDLDDSTLGKCIHFEYCKNNQQEAQDG